MEVMILYISEKALWQFHKYSQFFVLSQRGDNIVFLRRRVYSLLVDIIVEYENISQLGSSQRRFWVVFDLKVIAVKLAGRRAIAVEVQYNYGRKP
ncbi:hypothetical protein C5167_035440 [Papaver somniferum]|uniref:Uncharacterized protein n=1 Tax=Papaver somniferum TaxID=3469 RepID=A0A4Y7KFY4_PAPSO|nr:hypothetical protein C5167_035440 [Papaver somniferum]